MPQEESKKTPGDLALIMAEIAKLVINLNADERDRVFQATLTLFEGRDDDDN